MQMTLSLCQLLTQKGQVFLSNTNANYFLCSFIENTFRSCSGLALSMKISSSKVALMSGPELDVPDLLDPRESFTWKNSLSPARVLSGRCEPQYMMRIHLQVRNDNVHLLAHTGTGLVFLGDFKCCALPGIPA